MTIDSHKPKLMYDSDWPDVESLVDTFHAADADFETIAHRDANGVYDQLKVVKEAAATAALSTYNAAGDLTSFSEQASYVPLINSSKVNFDGRRLSSPTESLHVTVRNLNLARRYADAAYPYAYGVVMSGSNAWGSFYAPHAGNVITSEKSSDVDLLIEFPNMDAVGEVVERYVANGLTKPHETQRFDIFTKMADKNDVDVYSLRTYETGTEVSIHMVASDAVRRISCPMSMVQQKKPHETAVGVLKDFRPNTSTNVKKHKGYALNVLDEAPANDKRFFPDNRPVYDARGEIIGFIAESPIGGYLARNGYETYALGVLPFFMAIGPVIIAEKQRRMSDQIRTLQTGIAAIIDGRPVINIPRQDHMPQFALSMIRKSLSLDNERI